MQTQYVLACASIAKNKCRFFVAALLWMTSALGGEARLTVKPSFTLRQILLFFRLDEGTAIARIRSSTNKLKADG